MLIPCFRPPRPRRNHHNILTSTCMLVRKMHVDTRLKGRFGGYGLFIKPHRTGKVAVEIGIVAINNCSFFNADPIFIQINCVLFHL